MNIVWIHNMETNDIKLGVNIDDSWLVNHIISGKVEFSWRYKDMMSTLYKVCTSMTAGS